MFTARDYVADGTFTSGIEGPAVGPDGNLYVVNYAREGTIGRVHANTDGSGSAELFVELPAGSTGNGIRFDKSGTMYVADYSGHNILGTVSYTHLDVYKRQPWLVLEKRRAL